MHAMKGIGRLSRLNIDLSGKFIIAIAIGITILFTLSAVVQLSQQKSTLGELLGASTAIVEDIFEHQISDSRKAQLVRTEKMTKLLAAIAPSAIAEFELSALMQYAIVATEDPDIGFVAFYNTDNNVLGSAGSKEGLPEENIVSLDIASDGLKLGYVSVGFNDARLKAGVAKARETGEQRLSDMGKAKDDALSMAMISLAAIMVVNAIAVGLLSYFLFQMLVIRRMAFIEERFRDIAEGEGDLRKRVTAEGNDSIDRLAKYFNLFLEKIHATIKEVMGSVVQLSTSAEHMSIISTDTSGDILKQQSEVEQLASAITEMTATVQEIAKSTAAAAQAAQEGKGLSEQGSLVVNNTMAGMKKLAQEVNHASETIQQLAQNTEDIGLILDVIKGISDQTNLLALNAAIEAARAGEQGRGFAVVADEVRTLAQRTRQSTDEIQVMIENLQTASKVAQETIERGCVLAESSVNEAAKAGEALSSINKAVTVISDMNHQIASASEEQATVAGSVDQNINMISQVATQTADGAKKTAEASGQLTYLAEDLQRLVHQYKA